jgi:hypothetical protein
MNLLHCLRVMSHTRSVGGLVSWLYSFLKTGKANLSIGKDRGSCHGHESQIALSQYREPRRIMGAPGVAFVTRVQVIILASNSFRSLCNIRPKRMNLSAPPYVKRGLFRHYLQAWRLLKAAQCRRKVAESAGSLVTASWHANKNPLTSGTMQQRKDRIHDI